MVSKMVTDRQKLSDDVVAWANANAPALEKALAGKLGNGIIKAAAIRAIAHHVAAGLDVLVTADEAHTKEQADDVVPRGNRDAARDEVSKQIIALRRAVESAYDRPGLLALGIHERHSYDPVHVARLGKRVVELSTAKGFRMPDPNPDVKVDVPSMIAKLEAPLAKLSAALDTVDKEAAELTGTQTAKDDAMDAFDTLLVGATTTLRGLAVLAGLRKLARGLPLLRRGSASGGETKEVELSDEGEDTGDETP